MTTPSVAVEWHPMAGVTADGGATEGRWVVVCKTGDCRFRAYHIVKAGAQEEARWHRAAHRQAGY